MSRSQVTSRHAWQVSYRGPSPRGADAYRYSFGQSWPPRDGGNGGTGWRTTSWVIERHAARAGGTKEGGESGPRNKTSFCDQTAGFSHL